MVLLEAYFASLSASISNAALIGLPILIAMFGNNAFVPVTLTLVVFVLFILPLFTVIIEYALQANTKSFLQTLRNALKKMILNPLILAALAGIMVNLCRLNLPAYIQVTMNYLTEATVPCALVSVGMGLQNIKVKETASEIICMSAINVIIKPVLALAFALLFHLNTFFAISLIVVSAVPTSKTLYVLSKKYQQYEQETAGVLFLTSIISLISFPIFLILAKHFWLGHI